VSGDDDQCVPLGVARRLAQRFDAPLHVARGHGHFLFAEPGWQRDMGVILDWLDALPTAVRAPEPRRRPQGAVNRTTG
jgi:pimeloyl-ACP methyl ester carboxylesterase